MTGCTYLIAESDIAPMCLSDIGSFFESHAKKVVGQIELRELASLRDYPNGIYLFYKSGGQRDELVYVGKATSRSFIERIPAHFDSREDAWMNSLPKHAMRSEKLGTYQDALALALSLKVLLLGVQGKSEGGRMEGVLRSFLAPRYNATRSRYTGAELLSDLLATGDVADPVADK